jgi:hypothetical protein
MLWASSVQEANRILGALDQPLVGSIAVKRTRILVAVGVILQATMG